MKVVNDKHPRAWQIPIKAEFGITALIIVAYAIIPETPWYYARRNEKEKGLKAMRRLYFNVEGYDYEEEWGIIMRTIAHEREEYDAAKSQPWSDCFTGLNGVSQPLLLTVALCGMLKDDQKRMVILLVMCTGQQVGGNSLISTYSTCEQSLLPWN